MNILRGIVVKIQTKVAQQPESESSPAAERAPVAVFCLSWIMSGRPLMAKAASNPRENMNPDKNKALTVGCGAGRPFLKPACLFFFTEAPPAVTRQNVCCKTHLQRLQTLITHCTGSTRRACHSLQLKLRRLLLEESTAARRPSQRFGLQNLSDSSPRL